MNVSNDSKRNGRGFIQHMFPPMIGVLTSVQANEVCFRNNLTFVELIQPFSTLSNDAQLRDISGSSVSVRGLHLGFCDVNWRPPQATLAHKILNEAVRTAYNDETRNFTADTVNLTLPNSEPWFEHWREKFFSVMYPSDHEFTRHFLSCIIVLSTSEDNIIETANKLSQQAFQMQNIGPQKFPKWFQPNNVLNSYVILHENSRVDFAKAQQCYELLKSTIKDNKCFLIQLNSLDEPGTEVPDYWSPFLKNSIKQTESDQHNFGKSVQDSVATIPSISSTIISESSSISDTNLPIYHPLSPVQDSTIDATNTSNENLASYINTDCIQIESEGFHGNCLTVKDVENIRYFVQDYTVCALIPYIENLINTLHEEITNKKGVSKSLLSATKRWFINTKPGAGSAIQNAVIYTHESSELQTRKLGDLYFMFGHYNLAFQIYHQAKRDFNADSAWQYYAGALEMAAISAFMLGTANRKTYDYMEDAILCYFTVCRLHQFATRATLLSIECLKSARLHGDAAKQLIRMTNEESDLRSALFLEQAAYCFVSSQPSMYRKYAFHIVLAGNRYSRAGQREHAYRCYQQAYEIFQERSWSLAEDHIQYTMAKQACALKKLNDSCKLYACLLRPDSLQNTQQQANFLKEYIQIQNEYIKRTDGPRLITHVVPQVKEESIRILTGEAYATLSASSMSSVRRIGIEADLTDESIWCQMEEMIVTAANNNRPIVFKPSRILFTKKNLSLEEPVAIKGESIEISVALCNNVRNCIIFSGIDLLWEIVLNNGETLSNVFLYETYNSSSEDIAVTAAMDTISNQSIIFEPLEEKTINFKLVPKVTGYLNIIGIVGRLAAAIEPTINLLGRIKFREEVKGLQLLSKKLTIKVLPTISHLSVDFSSIPDILMTGEVIKVMMSLQNCGSSPIGKIFIGCDKPRWLTTMDNDDNVPLSVINSIKCLANEKLVKEKEIRRQYVFSLLKKSGNDIALLAGANVTIPLWIQAPYQKGPFTLRLLIYFELIGDSKIKYRLIRHIWKLNVHECLQSSVTCVRKDPSYKYSLNVNIKNKSDIKAELCLNSLHVLYAHYKLDVDKYHVTNKVEVKTGQLGEFCLEPSRCSSFQCELHKAEPINTAEIEKYFKGSLSFIHFMTTTPYNGVPPLEKMYGFLAKNETNYFDINVSTDEFYKIVSHQKPHITVIISWMASVFSQNARQRSIFGQHFIQLENLYETKKCPEKTPSYPEANGKTNLMEDILNFGSQILTKVEVTDFWEINSHFTGKRCLIQEDCIIY